MYLYIYSYMYVYIYMYTHIYMYIWYIYQGHKVGLGLVLRRNDLNHVFVKEVIPGFAAQRQGGVQVICVLPCLQWVAMCCSVLHCVQNVCCTVLRCVAVDSVSCWVMQVGAASNTPESRYHAHAHAHAHAHTHVCLSTWSFINCCYIPFPES